jgi:hypothetical protein
MSLFPAACELVDRRPRVRLRHAVEERCLHVRHLLLQILPRLVVLEGPAGVAGRADVHEADLDRLAVRLPGLGARPCGALAASLVVSPAGRGGEGEKERGEDRGERAKHEGLLE